MAKNRTTEVVIELDRELCARLHDKLSARGLKLEKYIEMTLRAFDRQKNILHLRDKINFGKYYGEVVEDVVRMDPGYISWCLQEWATRFGPDVFILMEALDDKEESNDDDRDEIPY